MPALRQESGPIGAAPFVWVCRYYRHLRSGEDLDPCIEAAVKQVMASSGDVFAICEAHLAEHAEAHQLEVVREL